MPRKVHCVKCNRHTDECGPLSTRKRCEDCGVGEVRRNAVELHEHRGPRFERWLRGNLLALLNLSTTLDTPLGLFSDAELEHVANGPTVAVEAVSG